MGTPKKEKEETGYLLVAILIYTREHTAGSARLGCVTPPASLTICWWPAPRSLRGFLVVDHPLNKGSTPPPLAPATPPAFLWQMRQCTASPASVAPAGGRGSTVLRTSSTARRAAFLLTCDRPRGSCGTQAETVVGYLHGSGTQPRTRCTLKKPWSTIASSVMSSLSPAGATTCAWRERGRPCDPPPFPRSPFAAARRRRFPPPHLVCARRRLPCRPLPFYDHGSLYFFFFFFFFLSSLAIPPCRPCLRLPPPLPLPRAVPKR